MNPRCDSRGSYCGNWSSHLYELSQREARNQGATPIHAKNTNHIEKSIKYFDKVIEKNTITIYSIYAHNP